MASSSHAGRIFYVEDDVPTGRIVKAIAEKEGYALRLIPSGKDFLKLLPEDPPDLCLLDLTLPDASGLDLLDKLRRSHPNIPAIVVTASESVEDVVAAMKMGASDYVTKPVNARRLAVSLRNALRLGEQQVELARLRSEVQQENGPESLVGSSTAMESLRSLIRKVAPSEATILVMGENGTGKELVARALHFSSPRAPRPLVDVNCAALTETLLESELFGHEMGAFTGASGRRAGKFEQAHGGTLFLDEIGDMPLSTQAKILRVLQERTFQRVGGTERIAVDVRVICATNRDLEEAVRRNEFRKDLFYRVNTLVIEVPALRDRAADIPELARHFLARAARHEKRPVDVLSPAALEALAIHSWPGNVRELQHAIERAVLVCETGEVRPEHLPPAILRGSPAGPPSGAAEGNLVEAVERLERAMILDALRDNGWVKARAARALGLTERMIAYKMQNLGIDKPQ
jgi:two-component system NtrC family response regulator